MRIIFVSSGQYPNGGAATNRHLAYAKGLVELGYEVEFVLLVEQKWNEQEILDQGIKFTCVPEGLQNKSSKIAKFKLFYNTIVKANKIILSAHQKQKISSLILLDTRIEILIPLINNAKKLGIKVFHERTEYPFIYGGKTIIGKLVLFIYLKFVLQKFDGLYVINNALKKYFLELTKNKIEIIVINMIVDSSRFEIAKNKSTDSLKKITYCGSIEGDKDGIPILIESFSLIAKEFPLARLQLITASRNPIIRQSMFILAQKYGIVDRFSIRGPLDRNQIPRELCDSDILALSRPDNAQAEGGFPTKLGEYLATGNPVVITNVGEINLFLSDGLNAFVAEPNSAEKFADKLREALLSKKADQIGIEGRKLVYNAFNYLQQAKILADFFEKHF
ncbi:MAG: glycosyltransferase family 4 protein [Bacteroidales bacterium]|nr:glycosyltransferase family 4 protein [Bacteroidales bacterium]